MTKYLGISCEFVHKEPNKTPKGVKTKSYLLPQRRARTLVRVSLTLAFCGVGAVPWPARGQVVPPTPVIVTAANLPADITASDFFGASAVFANTDFTLPDEVSAVAIDVDVTTSRPADLRVIVIDGDDQTGAETTFVLWDHDTLLDATKQLVTHLQLRAMLPSELVATITDPNRGVISVRVIDEVPASSGLSSAGTFNSCTLIINPDNSGHTAPPSVQLSINGQPAPSVPINFGGPVLIAARATANPSSFQITRLQTKITKLVSAPDPFHPRSSAA